MKASIFLMSIFGLFGLLHENAIISQQNNYFAGSAEQRNKEFIIAASKNNVREMMRLIDAGADASYVEPVSGMTALMEASLRGHVDAVCLLLSAGAPVDAVCSPRDAKSAPVGTPYDRVSLGTTSLHIAAKEGHRAVVALLLKAGADWMQLDNVLNGITPVDCAIDGVVLKDMGVLREMVNRGVCLTEKQKKGLQSLLSCFNNEEVRDINFAVSRLQNCCDNRQKTIIELLLDKGIPQTELEEIASLICNQDQTELTRHFSQRILEEELPRDIVHLMTNHFNSNEDTAAVIAITDMPPLTRQ